MTEDVWLGSVEPFEMLMFLGLNASERKLRLFGVECCRRVWELLPNDTCRNAVELAERYAEGLVTPKELARATGPLKRQVFSRGPRQSGQQGRWLAWRVAQPDCFPTAVSRAMIDLLGHMAAPGKKSAARKTESRRQCASIWDIFGNPFRPVSFDPAWRTETAVALARQMYESRDFSAMPILADALQDAGCDSDDILLHCRGPGPHARGCWVVDLVLGKE
jgi:hypothetical protein